MDGAIETNEAGAMTSSDTDPRFAIDDIRTFVPAQDFNQSKAFYEVLGWTTVWADDDGLALMELGGYRFMLQDYYVQQWAENFMLTIVVADAKAWYERVIGVIEHGDYSAARAAAPKVEAWGATVTYVWDPCGVLLHFTQFNSS